MRAVQIIAQETQKRGIEAAMELITLSGYKYILAIESSITCAYKQESLLALGYFLIHVGGEQFGVKSSDATLLASSFNAVQMRIAHKGAHRAPQLAAASADEISRSVMQALYWRNPGTRRYFGMPHERYANSLHHNNLIWAPDGDAAFDDGSHIIQFDLDDQVRIIAFKSTKEDRIDLSVDMIVPSKYFYGTLSAWVDAFKKDVASIPQSDSINRIK